MKVNSITIRRGGRLRTQLLPVFVWLAVLGCVIVLFRHRTRRFEVVGLAQAELYQVAATCTGRLKEIPVELFEPVQAGQTLAVIDTVLDNEALQAQLNTALAEVQHLKAQLAPTREQLLAEAANLETDRVAATRRFSVDIETARLRALELKTQLETDRMTLRDLALEVEVARELVEKDAVAPYELQKAQVQYDALAKTIEENENLLDQATKDFLVAQQRRDEFTKRQPQHPSVDSSLEVLQKAVKVQEQIVEELLARRVPLVLKSPFDGVVIQILVRANDALSLRPGEDALPLPGEVVMPGDPIVTVAQAKPSEIVAYAGAEQLGRVQERMTVELIKSGEPAQIASSQVAYLGPVMEVMPERLWRNPNIPQWGRPVLIRIPPGFELVPGELVRIRGL